MGKQMAEKGLIYDFAIEDMSDEGSGIGRIDGLVVFVPGAVAGDRVRARIVKVRKNFAVAELVELIEESPGRRGDICPHQGECGGCSLGALDYAVQLRLKENQVRNKLIRLGGVREPVLAPIIGMRPGDNGGRGCRGYRNKAVMPVSTGGLMTKKGGVQVPVHEPHIGFYRARSHDAVDCADCRIQADTAMAAAEATRRFMSEDHICSYDDRWSKGLMKSMTVRTAFVTGEVMVIYDINGKGVPNAEKLVGYLDEAVYKAGGFLESVVVRNGKTTETLAGKPTIADSIEVGERQLMFEISADSFYQVNHAQMERLYGVVREYCKKALEMLQAGARSGRNSSAETLVLDLYCGIGTIGLCVSDLVGSVHGIEVVKEAVIDANRNATINGIVNATYTCGKAEEILAGGGTAGGAMDAADADIAILDPPRAGCRRELLDAVGKAEIPFIIYVSCDPATLARDIKILGEMGYEPVEATPVDMFPDTGHVETVALLSKLKTKKHIEVELDMDEMI